MDYKELLHEVSKKNFWRRLVIASIAIFFLALNYNVFLLHNNLVIGGTSGIAIIMNKLFSIPPASFIFIFNILLIIISFIVLGAKQTNRTIIGSILYPLFVQATIPLAKYLIPYTEFDSMFLTVIVTAFIFGTTTGIIYKMGYTTGGADILMQILNKYMHIQTGKASFFVNFIIVGVGGLVFGWTKALYAVIIIAINTVLVDRILIGISDSKMFFIYTQKEKEVSGFILNEM